MPSCFDLTGRVAVVIGSTSGIGRALALGLAEHGASVVASGRPKDLVDEVARAIEAAGSPPLARTVDVRQRQSIAALREAAQPLRKSSEPALLIGTFSGLRQSLPQLVLPANLSDALSEDAYWLKTATIAGVRHLIVAARTIAVCSTAPSPYCAASRSANPFAISTKSNPPTLPFAG